MDSPPLSGLIYGYEDAAGEWGQDGGGGAMSLQSRFISYREGESGSMNYYGDRLRSLECVAGTKASQDAA